MNIQDLIHKLQDYPEDTEVQVLGIESFDSLDPAVSVWPFAKIKFIEDSINLLILEGDMY
jgi:hypothetical protein